jgi:hypothetical protein
MGNGALKRCGRCGKQLPLEQFARRGAARQSYCRRCQRTYDAAWYQANKSRRRTKVREDRAAHGAWMDSLKEGKACADCGEIYPPYVMEWDHLPGFVKTMVLADTRRAAHSKKRILEELEKCELVCANCHRERTFGKRRNAA